MRKHESSTLSVRTILLRPKLFSFGLRRDRFYEAPPEFFGLKGEVDHLFYYLYSQDVEATIGKKQFIIVCIIGILAISGIILPVSRFYHCGNKGMRGEIIIARAGKEFKIELDSNRTTGYQWQLAEPVDEKIIKFIRSEYIASNTDLAGAPGVENWIFIALKPGKSNVALKYVRSWERDNPPADKKEFMIIIR